jgi:hypothetical protein
MACLRPSACSPGDMPIQIQREALLREEGNHGCGE